jgi:hypothetical protein
MEPTLVCSKEDLEMEIYVELQQSEQNRIFKFLQVLSHIRDVPVTFTANLSWGHLFLSI